MAACSRGTGSGRIGVGRVPAMAPGKPIVDARRSRPCPPVSGGVARGLGACWRYSFYMCNVLLTASGLTGASGGASLVRKALYRP